MSLSAPMNTPYADIVTQHIRCNTSAVVWGACLIMSLRGHSPDKPDYL